MVIRPTIQSGRMVLMFEGWEVNAAVGRGLTTIGGGSNEYVIKAILGHEIGKLW